MEIKRQLIRFIFVSTFLLPIFNLAFYFEWNWLLNAGDIFRYFLQSSLQALFSCLLIGFFGAVLCVGLLGIQKPNWRKCIIVLSVLPAFAPAIFIVISFQVWLDLLKLSAYEGLILVSIVHAVMNLGMAGCLFFFLIERSLQAQANLAYLEGASRLRILTELLMAKRDDILIILLSFFGLCFTSFAVPLILGGSNGGTLEILAYRQLSQQGDLLGAFAVMALQWLCFYLLIRPFTHHIENYNVDISGQLPESIGFKWASLIGLIAVFLSLGGMFFGLAEGMSQFGDLLNSGFEFSKLLFNSIVLSLVVGLMSLGLYLMLAFLWMDPFLHKFSIGFGSVSSVLLGLGFFVMPIPNLVKLGIGLTILFFPFAYRVFGAPNLLSLNRQCDVADLLGASAWQRFTTIVLPQVLPAGLRLAGVVAFWTIGEYAFSSVVTGEIFHLGLLAKSFMLGYRLELATILNWIILTVGSLIFLGFIWGASVCSRKLEI